MSDNTKAAAERWEVRKTKLHGFDFSVVNRQGEAELDTWLIAGVRWEPHANLIAAVLDLLAACRALDESAPLDSEYGTCGCCGMRNRHESDCAVILARAAIAKATSPADKANAL